MNQRKSYINEMMKYLNAFQSGKGENSDIKKEDYSIITEMISLGYLNSTAFDFLGVGSKIHDCVYTGEYPLTILGKEYLELGWYQVLKQSGEYQLMRDIAAFIGAAVGIVVGIIQVIK